MSAPGYFNPRLGVRRAWGAGFLVLCALLSAFGAIVLGTLVWRMISVGGPLLSGKLLANYPSIMNPEQSGVHSALIGSIWLMLITAAASIPLGIGAAVYLEEYAPKNRFTRLLSLNISNLAGVPSIVYGLLGLTVFVRWMVLGRSLLAAGLTLALLVLPVIIIAAREAISAVPSSLRHAAFALGATRWQTIWHHVLPAALPSILTGVILALSRAIGEAAPLILIGAAAESLFVPGASYHGSRVTPAGFFGWIKHALLDSYSAMPIQVHYWTEQPEEVFQKLAAAAILVLMVLLLGMNAVAIGLRAWQQRKPT